MKEYIEKTLENLRKNNMEAFYAKDAEEAKEMMRGFLGEGDEITVGGSETLYKTGILEMLKTGPYKYYDRYEKGLSQEETAEIFRKAFTCDDYISSSNAITENGELYNVDGNSNRVAAILYGPKRVFIVAGRNKIVKDINEAVRRVKTLAAPKNCERLKKQTPCSVNGECISLSKEEPLICEGCRTSERICCNYVISAMQRQKGRITVIIIDEEIGY